jgi:hypothetical protein
LTDAQALAGNSDPNLRIWAAFALVDIGTPAALSTLATLLPDPDPSVASYATSARNTGALEHCDRVSIAIQSGGPQHLVNLASRKPVVVAVTVPTRGDARLERKAVTFGAAGTEQSLISCDDEAKEGISCRFRASLTGLQVSDGVATLRAKRSDGRCVVGRDAVQVVNIPVGQEGRSSQRFLDLGTEISPDRRDACRSRRGRAMDRGARRCP